MRGRRCRPKWGLRVRGALCSDAGRANRPPPGEGARGRLSGVLFSETGGRLGPDNPAAGVSHVFLEERSERKTRWED